VGEHQRSCRPPLARARGCHSPPTWLGLGRGAAAPSAPALGLALGLAAQLVPPGAAAEPLRGVPGALPACCCSAACAPWNLRGTSSRRAGWATGAASDQRGEAWQAARSAASPARHAPLFKLQQQLLAALLHQLLRVGRLRLEHLQRVELVPVRGLEILHLLHRRQLLRPHHGSLAPCSGLCHALCAQLLRQQRLLVQLALDGVDAHGALLGGALELRGGKAGGEGMLGAWQQPLHQPAGRGCCQRALQPARLAAPPRRQRPSTTQCPPAPP
jgi:hypothetical protein